MNKTAEQIADAVLEKIAVSPGLAAKALASRISKKAPMFARGRGGKIVRNGGDLKVLKQHPRTTQRAGSATTQYPDRTEWDEIMEPNRVLNGMSGDVAELRGLKNLQQDGFNIPEGTRQKILDSIGTRQNAYADAVGGLEAANPGFIENITRR